MKKGIAPRPLLIASVCFIALSLCGCDLSFLTGGNNKGATGTSAPAPMPGQEEALFVVGLDQSTSTAINQQNQKASRDRQQSLQAATNQFCDQLHGGHRLMIFGVHSNTLNDKPIFDETMPVMPDDPGYDVERRIRKEWARIRALAKAGFAEAFNPETRDVETDLMAIANRIPANRPKNTILILIGDLVHSTKTLDLETMRLSDKRIPARLNSEIGRLLWRKGMLEGVSVHCFLNGLGIRQRQPLNSRPELRRFWEQVFGFLNAEVQTFDSVISFNLGGNHVPTIQRTVAEDQK